MAGHFFECSLLTTVGDISFSQRVDYSQLLTPKGYEFFED
jgi:hypothetical protein